MGLLHGQETARPAVSDASLEAYYTYGSVLAFNGKCDDAERILAELARAYAGDPIVADIVGENRTLCATRHRCPQARHLRPRQPLDNRVRIG